MSPRECEKAGRCFHLERVDWMLRVSGNVAMTIQDKERRKSYVEYFLNKAIGEESVATQCPVFGEG